MKTKNLVCMFLLLVFFISCKKNDSENITENADKVKLDEWFSKLAPNSTGLKKELKEKLKESLLFNQSWQFKGGPEASMMIIPMNDSYRLKNNADKEITNFLAIELDVAGNYKRGFIWQVASGSTLNKNTLFNLYSGAESDLNGNYYMLDLWDNLIYRMKYENGKRTSLGSMEAKQSTSQRTSGLVCTD